VKPIHVRGSAVTNTVRSVRQRFGEDAHQQVLEALPQEHRGPFLASVRDAAWVPIDPLVRYMELAAGRLVEDPDAFYRALGHDAGEGTRHTGVRLFLGDDPGTATTRAMFFWRFFYDQGRVACALTAPRSLQVRLQDFRPPSRAWCHRTAGFLEGCLSVLGLPGRVEETACVHQAADACELMVTW